MVLPGLAIHPPAVTVTEVDDPTVAGCGIEVLDLDAVQLESVPLRVRRIVVRLDGATVVYQSANARVRTRTTIGKGLAACVVTGPHARGTVNGWAVAPGMMLVAGPGAEASVFAEAGWESVTFLVRASAVRECLVASRGAGVSRLMRGVEALQVDAARARALYAWGRRLAEAAAREPAGFDAGGRQRQAAQAQLLGHLLAALGETGEFEPTRGERTRLAHSRIVRAAEDHVLARVQDRVQVADLCRAASVSERTLEYAFKDLTGLTPVGYLTRLRLHRVRRALLAASGAQGTVAAEALNWGFWHFGEFARTYRKCFGELPSDTLRRAHGAVPPRHSGRSLAPLALQRTSNA